MAEEVVAIEDLVPDPPTPVAEGGSEQVVVIEDGGGYVPPTSGGGGEEAVADHEAKPDPHPQYLTDAEAVSLYEPVGTAGSAVSAHVAAADPHPVYATDADLASGLAGKEAAGSAASAVSAHVAAADPHTGYQKGSEKGQSSGYASLGADGKVPSGQLPAAQAGVTDHGALTGLSDPDHPIAAVIGLQTALDGKSAISHNHGGVYDPTGTAASSVAAHEGKADPHPQYLTPAEATAAYEVVGAVTTHEAKADPHPQYLTPAEGSTAYEPAGNISSHNSSGAAHSALRSTFPPIAVDASTGATGTGSVFARTDHRHQVTTAAPVSLGAANAAGTSNSLARADHVHQYPTPANVGAEPAGAVAGHEAKPNPHPQYMAQGNSGVVPVYADEDSLPAGEPGAIAFVTDPPDPDRHYYSYDPNSGWVVLGNANQKTMYWATEDGFPMFPDSSAVWFPAGTSLTGGGDGVHIGLPYWKSWTGSQSEYDAIGTKDPDTLYVVTG